MNDRNRELLKEFIMWAREQDTDIGCIFDEPDDAIDNFVEAYEKDDEE